MNIDHLNFSPLLCEYYNAFHITRIHHHLVKRRCNSYEIEFLPHSSGGTIINNVFYPLRNGDLSFRRPGDIVESISPYDSYFLCFCLGETDFFPDDFTIYDSSCPPNYKIITPLLQELPSRISLTCFPTLLSYITDLLALRFRKDDFSIIKIKKLLLDIIFLILSAYNPAIPESPLIHPIVKKFTSYLEENYADDLNINLYLSQLSISKAYFYRCFKDAYHISPLKYITQLRMQKAKSQLLLTQYHITDIALQCGYPNYSYFTQLFKQTYGMTPYAYRKSIFHK